MSTPTEAFSAGSGHSASVISALIVLAVGAVFVTLVAHLVLGLWENHQAGRLEARDASTHAMRLVVLLGFLLVLLVAH